MQKVCEKGLIIYNTCLAGNDRELEMGISSRKQEFPTLLINECLLGREKKPFCGHSCSERRKPQIKRLSGNLPMVMINKLGHFQMQREGKTV